MWTSDELNKIGGAEELRIASLRRDGTLRKPVIIWVVRVGDDIYVRSAYGPNVGCLRGAKVRNEGRIIAGGVEKDVTFEDADAAMNDQIDDVYRTKYRRRRTIRQLGDYAGSAVHDDQDRVALNGSVLEDSLFPSRSGRSAGDLNFPRRVVEFAPAFPALVRTHQRYIHGVD
jgi:hypothetical protein